jgi:hypothetical protein
MKVTTPNARSTAAGKACNRPQAARLRGRPKSQQSRPERARRSFSVVGYQLAVALMRTVEIDALVSVRKHSRRSASLAAIEATTLPLLSFIGGVNTTALPVALVAALAAAALFRGRFAAARVLVPLLAAFNVLLLLVIALKGTPNVEDGFYPATLIWLAAFLFGSLEGLLACATPLARRAAESPLIEVVLAGNHRIAALFPGGPTGWLQNPRLVTVCAVGAVIVGSVAVAAWVSRLFDLSTSGARNVVVLFTGWFAVWLRRRLARRGEQARRVDPRAPVVFLRSFGDDMLKVGPGEKWTRLADWHRRGMTFERVLTRELTPFGPVIAIGKPGESLAPLGAARDYVGDDTWQDEVARRITEARLVVFVVGESEGLGWELQRVHRLGLLHKLVLVFPTVDDISRRWNALVVRHRDSHDFALPDAVEPTKTLALAYEADGSPVAIVGNRGEWAYETALRLAALFARPGARLQEAFPKLKEIRVAEIASRSDAALMGHIADTPDSAR